MTIPEFERINGCTPCRPTVCAEVCSWKNTLLKDIPSQKKKFNVRSYKRSRMHFTDDELKECSECGSDYHIQVHHRDGVRSNNSVENLEILCCKCHAKRHHGVPCIICNKG